MPRPAPAWWHDAAAGNVAGACGITLAFPLDTIKCRLQTRPGEFRGGAHCAAAMVRTEGVLSLYRGLPFPLFGFGLINLSVFASFGATQRVVAGGSARDLTLAEQSLCGASAGFFSSFVRNPIERVKTVMQVRNAADGVAAPAANSLACARGLLRAQGPVGAFYRGLELTILRSPRTRPAPGTGLR